MYHYTYIIQHRTENKRYIGVRSSKCTPQQDINYWGSSKYLPSDISTNHVKIILKEFSTRQEALEHEILLHTLNNVQSDSNYYNKAKQTSTGFNTGGATMRPLSEEHRAKISKANSKPKKDSSKMGRYERNAITSANASKAQKQLYAQGYVNPRTGAVVTDETREKIRNIHISSGKFKGTGNARFTPWFITYPDGTTVEYRNTTKEQQSLIDGYPKAQYQQMFSRSKGIKPATKGPFKGYIVGNIVKDIV